MKSLHYIYIIKHYYTKLLFTVVLFVVFEVRLKTTKITQHRITMLKRYY